MKFGSVLGSSSLADLLDSSAEETKGLLAVLASNDHVSLLGESLEGFAQAHLLVVAAEGLEMSSLSFFSLRHPDVSLISILGNGELGFGVLLNDRDLILLFDLHFTLEGLCLFHGLDGLGFSFPLSQSLDVVSHDDFAALILESLSLLNDLFSLGFDLSLLAVDLFNIEVVL